MRPQGSNAIYAFVVLFYRYTIKDFANNISVINQIIKMYLALVLSMGDTDHAFWNKYLLATCDNLDDS